MSVEAGMLSCNSVKMHVAATSLLCQPTLAGIAEALLTCVFQGSVIWNSQMSLWQMNGNSGVMEVGIHALYRLPLCVCQGC